jgi:probable HAF family extracellular repeat protein
MQRVLLIVAVVALQTHVVADEPPKKYQLVAPRGDGIIATGLSELGDLVGFEWVEEKDQPGVDSQMPFYAKGKTLIKLPLLAGYTATHPAAVSDTALVVGRASKPAMPGRPPHFTNQAFVWDETSGIRGLGALKEDSGSFACGISRDGTRISGVSVGNDRIRACVWDRDGASWKGTALPQTGPLGSQMVVMSKNGRYIASVDGAVPCLWSRGQGDSWTREVISDAGSLLPRAVNSRGVVVGLCETYDGLAHAVIWTRAEGTKRLEKPPGFAQSEANAINESGVVVGMVDGPHGSPIGPHAFVYENGKLRLIDECGPDFTAATAINDHGQVSGVLEKVDAEERNRK